MQALWLQVELLNSENGRKNSACRFQFMKVWCGSPRGRFLPPFTGTETLVVSIVLTIFRIRKE